MGEIQPVVDSIQKYTGPEYTKNMNNYNNYLSKTLFGWLKAYVPGTEGYKLRKRAEYSQTAYENDLIKLAENTRVLAKKTKNPQLVMRELEKNIVLATACSYVKGLEAKKDVAALRKEFLRKKPRKKLDLSKKGIVPRAEEKRIEEIGKIYGKNSPEYKNALKNLEKKRENL